MQDGRNLEGSGGGQTEERGDEEGERGKEGGRGAEGGEQEGEGVGKRERGRERLRRTSKEEGEGVDRRGEEEVDSEAELTLLNQCSESLLEEARPRLIINIM